MQSEKESESSIVGKIVTSSNGNGSDSNNDQVRTKETKTSDRQDVIWLESEKGQKAKELDNTYQGITTSACAAGTTSLGNSTRTSGEASSTPQQQTYPAPWQVYFLDALLGM
jgi:hypothetical protein